MYVWLNWHMLHCAAGTMLYLLGRGPALLVDMLGDGCHVMLLLCGCAGDGNISLLDAQRRIRQRSEPAGALPGPSSNAGRTPFHSKAAGPSRFVVSQQRRQQEEAAAATGGGHWGLHESSVSPALPGEQPGVCVYLAGDL
jgi:hypothetical protein